jgi:hypothetical protein
MSCAEAIKVRRFSWPVPQLEHSHGDVVICLPIPF